eukprot:10072203-Heterocapsa_arctica.AAC.2
MERMRGKQKMQKPAGPELVQFDYSFLKTKSEEAATPILIGATRRAAYAFAGVVRRKGAADAGVAGDVLDWLREAGVTAELRIRSDGESAIKALMTAVAQKRGRPHLNTLETSPVKSSNSLGSAERYARTLAGMARTLRLSVEERMGVDMKASSLAFNLLVIHANFLYNCYQVRANGLTAYEDQMGHTYRGRLFQWGQPVLARKPAALEQANLEARW